MKKSDSLIAIALVCSIALAGSVILLSYIFQSGLFIRRGLVVGISRFSLAIMFIFDAGLIWQALAVKHFGSFYAGYPNLSALQPTKDILEFLRYQQHYVRRILQQAQYLIADVEAYHYTVQCTAYSLNMLPVRASQ